MAAAAPSGSSGAPAPGRRGPRAAAGAGRDAVAGELRRAAREPRAAPRRARPRGRPLPCATRSSRRPRARTTSRRSSASCALKWERHGEFSSYTFLVAGSVRRPVRRDGGGAASRGLARGDPGADDGRRARRARAGAAPSRRTPSTSRRCFGANTPVGSEVGEGNGLVYTDFRVHEDGFSRFLVMDRRFTPVQAGRTLQRLFEIEAYRMLALLSLPIARAQARRALGDRALARRARPTT